MSTNILSPYHECLVCGTIFNLHKHHVFEGNGRRELSEKYGCWCYLCARHHNMSTAGVHYDEHFDKKLKLKCQQILENDKGWSREKFIKMFGRSYEE